MCVVNNASCEKSSTTKTKAVVRFYKHWSVFLWTLKWLLSKILILFEILGPVGTGSGQCEFLNFFKNWHYLLQPFPPFFYEYLSQKLPKNMIHVNGTQIFAFLDFREVCVFIWCISPGPPSRLWKICFLWKRGHFSTFISIEGRGSLFFNLL